MLLRLLEASLAESIPETPPDLPEVTQPASASGLPPLSLDTPVEVPQFAVGVTALGTFRLLDVVAAAATPPAQRVGLVPPFPETGGTFRL